MSCSCAFQSKSSRNFGTDANPKMPHVPLTLCLTDRLMRMYLCIFDGKKIGQSMQDDEKGDVTRI